MELLYLAEESRQGALGPAAGWSLPAPHYEQQQQQQQHETGEVDSRAAATVAALRCERHCKPSQRSPMAEGQRGAGEDNKE